MTDTAPTPLAPETSPLAYRDRLIVLGLVLITLICYWPVGKADFINYDDNRYITENTLARHGLTVENIGYAFTSTDGGYRHPLTWITHMIDVELYGPKIGGPSLVGRLLGSNATFPGGHHLTNLLIHLANTLLLWHVIRRLTGAVWAAAWVAAIFAVHPVHVESVAWVSERKDVLSALFFMLSILAYLRFVEKPDPKRYTLLVLAFVAALLSKPMVMTIPCVLLLLNVWPLKRIRFDQTFWASLKRPLLETMPLLVFSVVSGLISVRDARTIESFLTLSDLPLKLRFETSIIAYARYLGKFFWPTRLVIFYPYPTSWPSALVAGSAALVSLITVIVALRVRKQPYLLVGWLWFLGMLVPVIGLVVTGDSSMADRYTYLSYIGLTLMFAWLAMDLLGRSRQALITLASMSVLGCMVVSAVQVTYWKDSQSVMLHALNASEDNWTANFNYAATLVNTRDENEAERYYKEAMRIRPNPHAFNSYASYLLSQHRTEEAAALLLKAYQLSPNEPKVQLQIARLKANMGHSQEAIQILDGILKKKPYYPEAQILAASAYMDLGQIDQAEARLQRAIEINPSMAMPYYQLAKIAVLRNQASAKDYFQKAMDLDPYWGKPHLDYAIVLANLHQYDEAMAQLEAALATLRETELAERSRAEWTIGQILEKQGRGLEAAPHYLSCLELAQKAVQAYPAEPENHYELAIRLKSLGRTDEANAEAAKTLQLAQAKGSLYFQYEIRQAFPTLATQPTTLPASRPATQPAQ